MKDPCKIMILIRSAVKTGAFPGMDANGSANWPSDPFHVLISTVLSQRTRDRNTANASASLFAKYNSPSEIANAPEAHLRELIRVAGFPTQKAKAIKEISRRIHEERGDEVPNTVEALVALPMVGRKTANCVLSYAFNIPAICVDTHVHRISNRIGLVRSTDPEGTETQLMKIMPLDLWIEVNSLMVRFGQTICLPRGPRCEICPVSSKCSYFKRVVSKRSKAH
ncbi:MAG: endonuclease III [Methanomassiliicoccales archaeon]|nr:endonuclease III [Methanomassiliicoccales archaeon]